MYFGIPEMLKGIIRVPKFLFQALSTKIGIFYAIFQAVCRRDRNKLFDPLFLAIQLQALRPIPWPHLHDRNVKRDNQTFFESLTPEFRFFQQQ